MRLLEFKWQNRFIFYFVQFLSEKIKILFKCVSIEIMCSWGTTYTSQKIFPLYETCSDPPRSHSHICFTEKKEPTGRIVSDSDFSLSIIAGIV